MKKIKIAFGGIHIESSVFTTYKSSEKDFIITKGNELLKRYPFLKEYKNVIPFPLIHARALPGGVVDRTFFNNFLNKFINKLKITENEIDALFFDIHGAMSVEGLFDAEGYFISKIKESISKDIIITTSTDLHGNISDLLYESTNFISTYRTAPHIDQLETRRRALDKLVNYFNNKKTVYKTKVDVPILLSGERTSTMVNPGKNLYNKIDEIIRANDQIIDVSIWMGFPWEDEPRASSSIVVEGYNKNEVEKEAYKLSSYYFNNKEKFKFVGPTKNIKDTLNDAFKSNKKPYFISDTGDNPGAGGTGDLIILLKEIIKKNNLFNKKILIASIKDKEVINLIYSNLNTKSFNINLGNKIDNLYGSPLNLNIEIINLFNLNMAGKCALVKHENIKIIITENRFQYSKLDYFLNSKINDLNDFDIVVVKMGYLEPELYKIANGWTMALTKGAVNQDLNSLTYKNIKRPMYPFDNDFDYKIKLKTKKVK